MVCSPPRGLAGTAIENSYCSSGASLIPVFGWTMIQSPPSMLYCARSILLVASCAVNFTLTSECADDPLDEDPPDVVRPSIIGGVLSMTKRSLSRSAERDRSGGLEGASVTRIFR